MMDLHLFEGELVPAGLIDAVLLLLQRVLHHHAHQAVHHLALLALALDKIGIVIEIEYPKFLRIMKISRYKIYNIDNII